MLSFYSVIKLCRSESSIEIIIIKNTWCFILFGKGIGSITIKKVLKMLIKDFDFFFLFSIKRFFNQILTCFLLGYIFRIAVLQMNKALFSLLI